VGLAPRNPLDRIILEGDLPFRLGKPVSAQSGAG
jgi:hypothetical protein